MAILEKWFRMSTVAGLFNFSKFLMFWMERLTVCLSVVQRYL